MTRLREDVERWLVHAGYSFQEGRYAGSSFHYVIPHAGSDNAPVEVFEPAAQPGVLVVGSKVALKNNQIARYLAYNAKERAGFEQRVAEYCKSIGAINKNHDEDGKQKIGVYVVLDDKGGAQQQQLFDAINRVSEMHHMVSRFLLKTF